ncbi:hypothetical protein F443_08326 [Phytophthora nicotianae P1569]|uniref:Uncharacterized protein n=2 Tax=Phytophthora nicotianae TaxID=4792 RepID=V9F7K0_PHYNI|nr:hypothetical protein F443_08326 [Phytophthora nicotianae P1569]
MRFSFALLLAPAVILLDSGNALVAPTDLNRVVNSNMPRGLAHNGAEYQRAGGRSLRTREDEDINIDKEEERGFFGKSKLPPGVTKEQADQIKLKWLKNSALYDDIIRDANTWFTALSTWRDMGYSSGKVKRAMKKLGKTSAEIKYHETPMREPPLTTTEEHLTRVARDRQSGLASELRESATANKATQEEVYRLEAAIERKSRRFRTLRDNYEHRLKVTDNMIAIHSAELDRLQDRKSRQDLESALATLQQERDALAVQRDELLGQLGERFMEVTDLRAERDQAQGRLSNIASLLPSTSSHKRARSESESPTKSARVSKAARSASGLSQADASSHAPVSRSSIEVLSAVAAGQKAKGSVSSPSSPGPDLSRSVRSTAKSGSGGASSSPAASEAGAPSDGGESSSGESGSTRVCDSDAAGSDSSSPELNRAKNEFGMSSGPLSDAELAALPPTTVPRSEWLPGYRDCRSFRGHDIVPWSAQNIRQTGIVEMDTDLLFHRFTKPMEWLIPLRDPVPPLGDWRDDLVDENNVRNLIETAPWKILVAPLDPLTFKTRGWFRHMKRLYASYEDEHLRAYWDSTHAFPVSITKRHTSRYLDAFYTDRKQRRSRAGARWKSFLQQVLIGLLRGYCDLDLLLDPFFVHFPRPGEEGAWYPGIEDGGDPADLLEALTITDTADRCHNLYRDVPEDHPALGIARLRGRSCPPLPDRVSPLCVGWQLVGFYSRQEGSVRSNQT